VKNEIPIGSATFGVPSPSDPTTPSTRLSSSTPNARYFQNASIATFAAIEAISVRRTALSSPRSRQRWIRRPAAKFSAMLARTTNRIACAPQT